MSAEQMLAHSAAGATFAAAATVLGVRARMDALLLSALTEPGLDGASVSRLRAFLDGDELPRARRAYAHLAQAGETS